MKKDKCFDHICKSLLEVGTDRLKPSMNDIPEIRNFIKDDKLVDSITDEELSDEWKLFVLTRYLKPWF